MQRTANILFNKSQLTETTTPLIDAQFHKPSACTSRRGDTIATYFLVIRGVEQLRASKFKPSQPRYQSPVDTETAAAEIPATPCT